MTGRTSSEATAIDQPVTPEALRAAMGSFLTGVAVMTTRSGGVPHGMTANAIASVSLDPPLVLVCVEARAVMADHVRAAGRFALSFLAEDQAWLSTHFADPARGQGEAEFAGVAWRPGDADVPVLDGVTGVVECRAERIDPAGDHLVVLGRVVRTQVDAARRPLGYFRGGYGQYRPERG